MTGSAIRVSSSCHAHDVLDVVVEPGEVPCAERVVDGGRSARSVAPRYRLDVSSGLDPSRLIARRFLGSGDFRLGSEVSQLGAGLPELHVAAPPRPPAVLPLSRPFLESAVVRLGRLSLLLVGVLAAWTAINLGAHHAFGWQPAIDPLRIAGQLVFVGASLGMFVIARRKRLEPQRVMDLGLFYEVIGALAIAVASLSDPNFFQADMVRISWVCVWITLFPLVVPNTLQRNAIASLGAACALPAVLLVYSRFVDVSGHGIWHAVAPGFICVGLALVPAYLMHHLAANASIAEAEARRLGSYRLVEQLGRGAMGQVWRAEHSLLARPAAVKLIASDRFDEDDAERAAFVSRFEREALALADLSSINTVRLYDFGVSAQGVPYHVMELLDGLDLQALVDRHGPVPPARVVHFLAQICSSLAEAHAAGMVHRDIKPANLFACRMGLEHDVIKVLDFGLVARRGGAAQSSTGVSRLDAQVGTPAYMAPETFREAIEVDARADIYALGCVAYFMLTAVTVFGRIDAVSLVEDHLHRTPVPPSRRADFDVPPALDLLILRCLAKDPAERPPSALSLTAQLLRVAEVTGPWTSEDARRWWAEHEPRALSDASVTSA